MSGAKNPAQNDKAHLYAVILAGGRGTRFWPRSRRSFPKQLMNFWDEASLLQQTVERLQPLILLRNVWIFTNQDLATAIALQLPGVPKSQIIAEPVQRNTAPCIGLAAEIISERDPEAVLGVFPSDQTIDKPTKFRKVVELAAKYASRGEIVVLGIQPRWAETGYGYMEFSGIPSLTTLRGSPVKQFREKPIKAVAKRYVSTKRFYWNSGMFFWKAITVRDALELHLPKTAEVVKSIAGKAGNPRAMNRALIEHYPDCQNISIDYAVLEKAAQVTGIPCDIGWNDVGSWNAVYDLLPRDRQGNVVRSKALLLDSSGLLVDVPGKLVVGTGLKDLIVVETPDALLIVPRHRAQEVSQLVKELEKKSRNDLL